MSAQTFKDIQNETAGENTFSICKSDDDKRLIFGWASVAIRTDGNQVLDWQKDIIDPEDLEEAVYNYVLDFRASGEEHIPGLRNKGRLVESVVFTKEKMRAMGIPEGLVPEGWWIGFYIDDDNAWAKVKDGTYQMFSIEGQGVREPVEEDTIGKTMSPEKRHSVAKTFEELLKFNPFHDAKGRFSDKNSFSSYSANPKTKAGAMAISRSAAAGHTSTLNVHRESKGENIGQNDTWLKTGQKPAVPAAQAPKTPPKPKVNYDAKGFADYDAADYHQLGNRKNYYLKQNLTAQEKQSAALYLQSNKQPGSLYSLSQNMNYKMANGKKLTQQEQQVHDDLMGAMHNLGVNSKLTRYDHEDMINSLVNSVGLGSDYMKVSEADLKKALVGQDLFEDKFLSVSTNDFANAPGASQSTFTTRAVKIVYKAKAKTQAMMPGNGPGGDLGEVILAPTNGKNNSAGKIVDIKFNGNKARKKQTQNFSLNQIEITIEI